MVPLVGVGLVRRVPPQRLPSEGPCRPRSGLGSGGNPPACRGWSPRRKARGSGRSIAAGVIAPLRTMKSQIRSRCQEFGFEFTMGMDQPASHYITMITIACAWLCALVVCFQSGNCKTLQGTQLLPVNSEQRFASDWTHGARFLEIPFQRITVPPHRLGVPY